MDPFEHIKKVGFCDWFQDRLDNSLSDKHSIARVVSIHKDRSIVTNGLGEASAELAGSLLYNAGSSVDLPAVGDWVYVDYQDSHAYATIQGVLPRKTLLKRKTAGKVVDFQSIAANIDVAFIVQAADANFSLSRLERYLVMVNETGIVPVILLSKSDLVDPIEVDEIMNRIYGMSLQVDVFAFSNMSGQNIEAIKQTLSFGRTYCLLGSSGVGKTTLLNSILGTTQFETQSVNKKHGKGKHTTTNRELIQLGNGVMVIDTPGMRELGNMAVDAGLDETFADIIELSTNCKFRNCTHASEKGCAVLAAVESGDLTQERIKNYRKMKSESALNEMSYAEKRKKDKNFGKMVKAAVKRKKK